MSVPLDRLYNFLNDQSSVDLLIYRWHPHGSRKLTDCKQLNDHHGDIVAHVNRPPMICHDQEVLNFDLYSHWPHCYNPIQARNLCDDTGNPVHPNVKKFFESINLRSAVDLFNLHDRVLLLHSEKHSEHLEKFQKIGFVPVYYFSHALISLDWYRYAQYDKILHQPVRNFDRPFLIYNRAWKNSREYRLYFTQCLLDLKLDQHCNVKFSPIDEDVHYTDYVFQNPNLSISRNDLEKKLPLNTHGAHCSADYNNQDYSTCMVEIVLETLFDDRRWHLTEKTFRPIACGRPFLLAGTAGSLAYLREYGFRTFDGIIDEKYDTEQDPVRRLHAILQEMHRISQFTEQQRQDFLEHTASIAEFNRRWFFSHQFFKILTDEYKQNLHPALQIVNNHRTGKMRQRIFKLKSKYQTRDMDVVRRYYHDTSQL